MYASGPFLGKMMGCFLKNGAAKISIFQVTPGAFL